MSMTLPVSNGPQGDHYTFPFDKQTIADNLGLVPSRPKMPPLHYVSNITTPTPHRMPGLIW